MASTDLGHLQTAPATTPAVMHITLHTYTCVDVIHVNVVTANNKTHAISLTLLKDHQTNIVFLYSTDNSYALLYSLDAADGHAHIYIYTYSMFITPHKKSNLTFLRIFISISLISTRKKSSQATRTTVNGKSTHFILL